MIAAIEAVLPEETPQALVDQFAGKPTEELDRFVQREADLEDRVVRNLDGFIERIHNENKPTIEVTRALEAVQNDIEETLTRSESFQKKYRIDPKERFGEDWTGYEVYMFGSAVNGLMSKESDLDLTVLIDDCNLDH